MTLDWLNPLYRSNAQFDGINATLTSPIAPDGRPVLGADYTVPARQGRAVRVARGQRLVVTNPSGTQVCDFWAFVDGALHEFLSMEHLRAALSHLTPKPGDTLVSNRRRPLLRFVDDTSPGVHDTLIAACDLPRYRQLGVDGHHDSCSDNLRMAMAAIGCHVTEVPSPFNVLMNTPPDAQGRIAWLPPVARAGDRVVFEALI
ncbi:MAG: urea carboxylase-associated family protein, partial [Burkholderiales bacterium]|nr:urea carboxylase-associated family protein [Burkholderiales bacterium]